MTTTPHAARSGADTTSAAPLFRILVVDDDQEHAATVARVLRRAGYGTVAVYDVEEALQAVSSQQVDLVLTDLVMPGATGLELIARLGVLARKLPVLLMTAFGTVEHAVEAMRAGAADFVVKPIDPQALLRAVERALAQRRLQVENESLRQELTRLKEHHGLVGSAPAFVAALRMARQAANSDATVMLLGESGSGKELFARHIHDLSRRAAHPYVTLNCAALPESIIESELFGHEAGAFTGARTRRIGHFEAAHTGTLLLDEVGELPLSVQVRLLRVLQEGEILRVGGTAPVRVDVRIIAATHRDLGKMVEEGTFREDLFYRLEVIPIRVPPLRERVGDLPLLVRHLLQQLAGEGRPAPLPTREAMAALERWQWPGNVRELRNVLERAVVLDQDGELDCDDLPIRLVNPGGTSRVAVDIAPATPRDTATPTIHIPVGTTLDDAERQLVLATLAVAGGDKQRAAQLLGIGRRTIYRRLETWGLDPGSPETGDA